MLLGSVGAGAIAGALVMPRLRARLGTDGLVLAAAFVTAAATASLALAPPRWLALVILLAMGGAWIIALTTLNATAQSILPNWVRGRALAVSAAQRSPVMPDVPTIGEAGFPAATFSVWQVLMAPSAMPDAMVARIQAAAAETLAEEATRRQLLTLGVDRIVGNTPAQAQEYVAAEIARWEAVLKNAGIQPQ